MKKNVYKGRYISVSEERINNHVYERVQLRPGVQVIPVEGETVLLIKEKRTHEDTHRWKLVSGWRDKEDKTALEHAQEELAEEANMKAKHWEELEGSALESATFNPNTTYFLCHEVSELPYEHENPDSCIVYDKRWFSFEEVFELVSTKEAWCDDTILVALVVLYNQKKKSEN